MVDLHLSVHLSMVRQPALLASWLSGSEGWLSIVGEVALKVRTRGSILSDYSTLMLQTVETGLLLLLRLPEATGPEPESNR